MKPENDPPLILGPDDVISDPSDQSDCDHEETQTGYHSDREFSSDVNSEFTKY